MKVKDLVSFSKETFFNGAVQTEWFYDAQKAKTVAESYVFHGPKYYGCLLYTSCTFAPSS